MTCRKTEPEVTDAEVLFSIRDWWRDGVHVWEWLDVPPLFIRFNTFGEDARRAALVPLPIWEAWQEDQFVPWWLQNLGGPPDETTGIPNTTEHILAGKWVLVIGGK